MKNNFFKKYWFILLLVLISSFYIQFLFSGNMLLWDEPVYLGNARGHITTSHFTEDFRFPLLEYFTAFVWLIVGESVLSAQILMILFSLFTIYAVYLISKIFFKEEIYIFLTTFLFAFSSTLFFWSYRIYTDVPSLCFMLFGILFFLKFLKKKENVSLFISGVFTSLAFLMRFSAILFSFIIIAYLVFFFLYKRDKKHFNNALSYALGNLIVLIPWMLYNYLKYRNPLWDIMEQSSVIAQYTTWQSPLLFLKDILLETGLSVLFLIPYLIYFFRKKKYFKDYFLFILIFLTLAFHLFFIKLKLTRYVLMISPFLFLAIVQGIKYISKFKFKAREFVNITLIVLVIINSLFLANIIITKMEERAFCENGGAFEKSITYMKSIPEGETIVSNSWPYYSYFGNHKVYSLWTPDLEMFIREHKASSFVYVKYGGLEQDPKIFEESPLLRSVKHFKDSCNQEVFIYTLR